MNQERKKTILLVGLGEQFVASFALSHHVDAYQVGAVDDAVGAIKILSNSMIDAVVFRYDQDLIQWNSFIDIATSIHASTHLVMLFEGSVAQELEILTSPVDVCLPLAKEPILCFEYIHRLLESNPKTHEAKGTLNSRGLNNFEIDLKSGTVMKNGEEILLTHLEYLILVCLIKNNDKTLNRQEIFSQMYQYEEVSMAKKDRRIDMHIAKLRQKVGSTHIRSIRGKGYRWDCL